MDHHDGNGRGRLPRGYRRCSRYRNDYVDRERDEFSCQRGQPFQLAFGLTLLNYDGLAVDIASLRQASHYTVNDDPLCTTSRPMRGSCRCCARAEEGHPTAA